ncbi:MAG: flagellar hook-length control protein FliK [Halioglobus sp.]|nr:flagellar hook-length control protein FliK [Halioglobus sp.]
MEDLQLALTAARVDQKNTGLWLRNWQVGQVLQALVTDRAPSGQIVLRIGAQQITATADIPVQKGAVLNLEVTSLGSTPTLKILGAVPTPGQPVDALRGQIQLLVPRQGRVSDPLAMLMDPARSANILALLGAKGDAVALLLKHLSRFEQLTDPRQLRAAIDRCGLFLEPRLLQLERHPPTPPGPDFKADLLQLRAQLDQALSGALGGAPGRERGNATLLALREQVDGALSTITLNQLAARTPDERGGTTWLVHLPLAQGESAQSLSLSIRREHRAGGARGEQVPEWQVLLNVCLDALGDIEAELYLRGEKLAVVLYAERARTADLLDSQSQRLRSALQSRGMTVSVLLHHQGRAAAQARAPQPHGCVDERV